MSLSIARHIQGQTLSSRSSVRAWILTCFMLAACHCGLNTARAERWTDLSGATTIEAQFLGIWDGKVILQKADGQRLAVPLMQLNAESRLLAEDLVTERENFRKTRLEEIAGARKLADKSQPLDPVGPLVPIPNDASLQQALDHARKQMDAGHPEILWDLLPASWKADVNEVVRLAAMKLEPTQWQSIVDLMRDSGAFLKNKKEFILNHPAFALLAGASPIPIGTSYDAVVGLFTEVADPQFWALENLQQIDLEKALATKGPKIGGYLLRVEEIASQSGTGPIAEAFANIKVEQPDDSTATITTYTSEGTKKSEYIRVENRWVPKELAQSWSQQIADAKSKIDSWGLGDADPLTAISLQTSMVAGIIAQLNAPNTQQDFNAAVQTVFGGLARQLAPLVAPYLPPPAAPAADPSQASPGTESSLDSTTTQTSPASP